MANSVSVVIASDQSPINVNAAIPELDVNLSTRASEATLLAINGKLNSLGQKNSADSVPVVIASDQPAIDVDTDIPIETNGSLLVSNDFVPVGGRNELGQAEELFFRSEGDPQRADSDAGLVVKPVIPAFSYFALFSGPAGGSLSANLMRNNAALGLVSLAGSGWTGTINVQILDQGGKSITTFRAIKLSDGELVTDLVPGIDPACEMYLISAPCVIVTGKH